MVDIATVFIYINNDSHKRFHAWFPLTPQILNRFTKRNFCSYLYKYSFPFVRYILPFWSSLLHTCLWMLIIKSRYKCLKFSYRNVIWMHNFVNMHSRNRQYMIYIVVGNLLITRIFLGVFPGLGCITWYGDLIIANKCMRPILMGLILISFAESFISSIFFFHLNNFHSNIIKRGQVVGYVVSIP